MLRLGKIPVDFVVDYAIVGIAVYANDKSLNVNW